MNDSALTLPQLKTELKAEIDRLDVKIDTVKTDLEAKIDRLDVKIDTVKTDLEAKIDDRTEQILAAVRDTAELIDERQDRRRQAELAEQDRRWQGALEAQRHVLQSQLYQVSGELRQDQATTRAALDEHVRDDSRHMKPRAPKTAR